MCHMGGRRKTINCTGSGSGSGSGYGSGAEACICILMPAWTGPQQSQRGKSKQMRLQTVKMAVRLGQTRAGTLVLGSTCSRGQFDRQQAKCQCPAWPARLAGLAYGTFPPLSLLDYTLCLVCLEVFPCYAHSADFCFAPVCLCVCVCVRGVEFPRREPQTKWEYKGNACFVYCETYSNIYTLCLPLISR